MNSIEYTIRQFVPPGSTLYYSLRYLPTKLRPVITLLLTLSRILQEIPLNCHDNQVARQKLQWWRIECERLASGKPTHPLMQALLPYFLPVQPFNQCIDALELQLEQQVYDNQQALEDYYVDVSAIEILALQMTALPEPLPEVYSRNLCCAWQVSQQLQQFRHLLLHHQAKFIQSQLQEVTLAELATYLDLNKQKKHEHPAVKRLLKNLHQQAQSYYQQALANLDLMDLKEQRLKQLPFLIYSELQLQILNEIAAENYPIFSHSIDLTPLRKLWLAWRIKQREVKKARGV